MDKIIKPGWKTTEFWTTLFMVVGAVSAAFQGIVNPDIASALSAVSVASYAISRGLSKKN